MTNNDEMQDMKQRLASLTERQGQRQTRGWSDPSTKPVELSGNHDPDKCNTVLCKRRTCERFSMEPYRSSYARCSHGQYKCDKESCKHEVRERSGMGDRRSRYARCEGYDHSRCDTPSISDTSRSSVPTGEDEHREGRRCNRANTVTVSTQYRVKPYCCSMVQLEGVAMTVDADAESSITFTPAAGWRLPLISSSGKQLEIAVEFNDELEGGGERASSTVDDTGVCRMIIRQDLNRRLHLLGRRSRSIDTWIPIKNEDEKPIVAQKAGTVKEVVKAVAPEAKMRSLVKAVAPEAIVACENGIVKAVEPAASERSLVKVGVPETIVATVEVLTPHVKTGSTIKEGRVPQSTREFVKVQKPAAAVKVQKPAAVETRIVRVLQLKKQCSETVKWDQPKATNSVKSSCESEVERKNMRDPEMNPRMEESRVNPVKESEVNENPERIQWMETVVKLSEQMDELGVNPVNESEVANDGCATPVESPIASAPSSHHSIPVKPNDKQSSTVEKKAPKEDVDTLSSAMKDDCSTVQD